MSVWLDKYPRNTKYLVNKNNVVNTCYKSDSCVQHYRYFLEQEMSVSDLESSQMIKEIQLLDDFFIHFRNGGNWMIRTNFSVENLQKDGQLPLEESLSLGCE